MRRVYTGTIPVAARRLAWNSRSFPQPILHPYSGEGQATLQTRPQSQLRLSSTALLEPATPLKLTTLNRALQTRQRRETSVYRCDRSENGKKLLRETYITSNMLQASDFTHVRSTAVFSALTSLGSCFVVSDKGTEYTVYTVRYAKTRPFTVHDNSTKS